MSGWIEVHQTLPRHRKTLKAGRILSCEPIAIVGALVSLWAYAVDHAEDGDLTRFDHEEIAVFAGWTGDGRAFVRALIECRPENDPDQHGFLEVTSDGHLLIHDWWDGAGKLVAARRKDKLRKRTQRAGGDQLELGDEVGECPEDVRRTSDGLPAESVSKRESDSERDRKRTPPSGGERENARPRGSASPSHSGGARASPASPYVPPTLEVVTARMKELGGDAAEARKFHLHYSSVGWQHNRQPLVDWQSRCALWLERKDGLGTPSASGGTTVRSPFPSGAETVKRNRK